MSRSRNFFAGLGALLAATLAGPAAAGNWSLTLAPSLFAPRLSDLNSAFMGSGFRTTDDAYIAASGASSARANGFGRVRLGYGGDLSVAYEINEDLRGSIFLGFSLVGGSDTVRLEQISSIVSGTVTTTSSTEYDVSAGISLPLFRVGLSIQKVFRFEDNPNLLLHLGGWGSVGTLLGASFHGEVTQMSTGLRNAYDAGLSGQGWGGGASGGAEFSFSPRFALFLESGFDAFIIRDVDARPSFSGDFGASTARSARFVNGFGKAIGLDFSGIFIRLGVRATFPSAS